MKQVRILGVIVLLMMESNTLQACQCRDSYDFFQYINNLLPVRPMVIAKAKILGVVNGYGTQLQIIYRYVGSTKSDTVKVWSTDGSDCRESNLTGYYSVGDTIMAILIPNYIEYPPESHDDYYISRCGATHLRLKGDSVYGGTYSDQFSFYGFPFQRFEDSLKKVINSMKLRIGGSNTVRSINIQPNPFTSVITVSGEISGHVSIFTMDGRLMKSIAISKTSQSISIDLSLMSAGCYIAKFQDWEGGMESFKLMKY